MQWFQTLSQNKTENEFSETNIVGSVGRTPWYTKKGKNDCVPINDLRSTSMGLVKLSLSSISEPMFMMKLNS